MSAVAALPLPAGPGPADRLFATALYALAVHAVLVFGLHARMPQPAPPAQSPPLEIVLLRTPPQRAAKPPSRPDYLAPENHHGSGQVARAEAPETRAVGVSAPPTPLPPAPVATPPAPPAAAAPAPRAVVTAPRGTHPAPPPRPPARVPAPPALPTTTELLAGVRDYAEIAAREGQRDLTPAARKREKYVDASTREHGYAAYLEAWRRKVEAIGNLNYPAAARAQRLSGTLRMSVRVAADGSVVERPGAPFLGAPGARRRRTRHRAPRRPVRAVSGRHSQGHRRAGDHPHLAVPRRHPARPVGAGGKARMAVWQKAWTSPASS